MSNINKAAVFNPFSDLEDDVFKYAPRASTTEYGVVALGSGIKIDNLGKIYTDTSALQLQINQKAETEYVDAVVGAISTDASKQYATLALANADIANITLNKNVFVSEAVNGGYWYKATAEATSLTKSAYDPLTQSKEYTDTQIELLPIEQINLDDYSIVFRDNNDVVCVALLIDKNGKPSIYMLNSIYEGLVDRITALVTDGVAASGVSFVQTPSGSCFVVDQNGQLSWFGITSEGLLPDYTTKCIATALEKEGFSLVPSVVKSSYQSTEINAVSGPDIVCYGDSMTYGATSDGNPYTKFLQEKITAAGSSAVVYNFGVGGETSPTICARQGGNPFILTFTDGAIPAAKTATTVQLLNINGAVVRPMIQSFSSYDGYLTLKDGSRVEGTIAIVKPNGASASWDDANYYTFTRKTAGSLITVDRPSAFYLDLAEQHLSDIHIIWIGQNNFADNARAIVDAKAMIQHMRSLDKRFIVMSKPGGTSAQDTDDAVWFTEFGRRFIPIRQYLVQYGLSDAGITPTAQDLTDISNGTVPTSLRNDSVHFKPLGYQIVANVIFSRLAELGWI